MKALFRNNSGKSEPIGMKSYGEMWGNVICFPANVWHSLPNGFKMAGKNAFSKLLSPKQGIISFLQFEHERLKGVVMNSFGAQSRNCSVKGSFIPKTSFLFFWGYTSRPRTPALTYSFSCQ